MDSSSEMGPATAFTDGIRRVNRALILLAGAGLLIRSFVRLQEVNPGFAAQGALVTQVYLPRTVYEQPARWLAFADHPLLIVLCTMLAFGGGWGWGGALAGGLIAGAVIGSVVKDPVADSVVWTEYLEAVVRERREWADFYRACREING